MHLSGNKYLNMLAKIYKAFYTINDNKLILINKKHMNIKE